MLGILLVIDLMAFALAAFLVRGQREFLRESLLIGAVLWGTAIVVSTEILSLFQAIGFWEVFIFWTMVWAGCLVFISKKWKNQNINKLFYSPAGVFLNRVVFFAICLGVIALFSPPSGGDSMIYHMSKVMHWIQDRSVAYYPTNCLLQLVYPAFAEYVILHFQLLSGGDYWANFVQWLAMCGSLSGVSLIARELGASRRGQVISALVAVTIPMGILQATSTQTDYVDTFWLCSFVYFFLCWRRSLTWGYGLLMGASLGLDLVTKGVVLIYAAPFLLWMLLEAARRMKVKKILMMGVAMACVAGLFYAGTLCRNVEYFHGHPANFVSAETDSMINARFCWEGFGANVLRNTALHLITPSYEINAVIKENIYKLASFLRINLNFKDWSYAAATLDTVDFRGIEDYLGNPLHLLLYGIVMGFFLSSPRFRNRDACFYLVACVLGWVLFSAILKWQPYHARFHLGAFVIFAPLAGLVMEKIRTKWFVSGAMGALFLSAWVIVLINVSKPIFSAISIFYPQNREFLHFIRAGSAQQVYLEYKAIAEVLKKLGCKNIGFIIGKSEAEYLLWVALNPTSDPSMRIESIFVDNPSANLKYPLGDFIPDAIIAINDDRPWANWENNIYQMIWHHEIEGKKVSVFLKRM